MSRTNLLLAGLLATAVLAPGCGDVDPVDDRNERDTGWAIAYLTGHMLNTHIVGRPAGRQDVTVECMQGGSVRVAGTTTYDNATALLSVDLTYNFSNTHAAVVATNLVVTFHPLTGTIRQTGTLRVGSGEYYENHEAAGAGLSFNATIERPGTAPAELTDAGSYDVSVWSATNSQNQAYRYMDGQLADHDFLWQYPLWGSNAWTSTNGIYVRGMEETDNGGGNGLAGATQHAGWGLVYLTGFLFNNYVATRAAGTHDLRVACSRGGSVRMNGTTSYNRSTAILSMDMTYTFSDANAAVTATNLVINFSRIDGAIRQAGAVRVGSGAPWEDHTSTSTRLALNATVRQSGGTNETVSCDGAYRAEVGNITNSLHEVYRRVDGQLDGQDFSWDYLISNAGTNTGVIRVNL